MLLDGKREEVEQKSEEPNVIGWEEGGGGAKK